MTRFYRKKKFLIIAGLVVVAVAVFAFTISGNGEKATSVQADLAFVDDIAEIVTASGRIQPQTKVDIVAEVSAQIIAVYRNEGDRVERGTPLLLLDTVQTKSDVEQARYSLDEITARAAAARSLFEQDKQEFERQSRLYEQKLTSETAYTNAKFANDNSRANFEATQAQVKTFRARLEKAEDNLRKTSIIAPMAGVVTFLNAEVGEIAQAQTSFTQGKTLMTISDLSVFEVEVEVDETEIAKIDLDQPAKIRVDAFRDTVFEGTVVEIGNSAMITGEGTDNYTTSFRVKVRFADTEATIRPGMSATVDITTANEQNAVLVPYAAIVMREFDPDSLLTAADKPNAESSGVFTDGSVQAAEITNVSEKTDDDSTTSGHKKKKVKMTGVFVIKNGNAKFIELATGIADDRNIVALGTIEPGDTVISGSFQTLRKINPGEAVTIDERSQERMKEDL
jgi:HlyD family secretion protein